MSVDISLPYDAVYSIFLVFRVYRTMVENHGFIKCNVSANDDDFASGVPKTVGFSA